MKSALGYEAIMGRWSYATAREFLRWLSLPERCHWLDLGCGTGALTRAILEQASPTRVVSVDPEAEYVAYLQSNVASPRCRCIVGDAQRLPLDSAQFDAVVSGLALNQIPEPERALREMVRVLRPDGVVAAYVWDFREGIQLLRHIWDAAAVLDPESIRLDPAPRFPLCDPERLRPLFTEAGLNSVEVDALAVPTVFRDFDDYWEPFLTGTGRAAGYVVSLSEAMRAVLRDRIQESLPVSSDGSIPLQARAWAVRGIRAGATGHRS